MTLGWAEGIGLNDNDLIDAAGHDRRVLATRVLQLFLNHALRDGFFHADMHQGNLKVAANGDIFVSDGHGGDSNARVVKFSKDGKFIKTWGKKGSATGDFSEPHSITLDTQGRVFCVGSGGIWVVSPSGEVIGIARMPEVIRNLAFGGPDFRTLYLTPSGSLSRLEVKTPGIGPKI